jgi:methylthioxylose transferase
MVWWFGFDLLRAFTAVARDAAEFNLEMGRPYALWVRQNLFDFVFGVGWCQTVLVAAALADGISRWPSRRRFSDMPPIVLICISLVAMVGAADAIGVNRGEVIRLWIFLACLAQIPAAYVCRRLGSPLAFGLVVVATLVQNVAGTAMIAFVVP